MQISIFIMFLIVKKKTQMIIINYIRLPSSVLVYYTL